MLEQEENNSKPVILYFEDDAQTAEMICQFLDLKGYQVIHFGYMPENSGSLLDEVARFDPVMVLLDIKMPGVNGYDICKLLRSGALDKNVPIVFTSGLMEEQDILKAFEVGGSDFITKPVKLSELGVKLEQNLKKHSEFDATSQQLDMAQKMAFKAMSASSEYGAILHFNERCIGINNRKELAQELINVCGQFQIKTSVLITGEEPLYLNSEGTENQLEQKAFEILRLKPRVYSWGTRTVLNFDSISLLILNMPVENDERYGELKDLTCLLMNGVQARLHAIEVEEREAQQRESVRMAAEQITNLIKLMDSQKTGLSHQFEKIIETMDTNISGDIMQFNLLQHEEKVLLDRVDAAMNDAQRIFDKSANDEKRYSEVLEALVQKLNQSEQSKSYGLDVGK